MNLIFFFLPCLTVAISSLRTVHHKYHLIKLLSSWHYGQSYCRFWYDDLATIITDDDWKQLEIEQASKGFTEYAWIGLNNDFNKWYWSLNEVPLESPPLFYSNWYIGEPNNNGGNEECVAINDKGGWSDYQCSWIKPFICYNANFDGYAKFISISTLLSWSEAQSYCQTYHTDLASSLNSSDNDLLMDLVFDLAADAWFGLYRDQWRWSDGTKATNLPWQAGQPDNYNGNEYCGSHKSKEFTDYFCSEPVFFLCHTAIPPREQQIVKLQLMSDGSVLDSAVQSLVLEKIKQKLEEKGMLTNTTVTWRVKPIKKNTDDL